MYYTQLYCSALTSGPQLCPINQHSESLLVAMQRRGTVQWWYGGTVQWCNGAPTWLHHYSTQVQLCPTVLPEYTVLVVATFYLLRWRIFTTLNTLYSREATTVYLVYRWQHTIPLPTSPYLSGLKYRHNAFCATANILFMAAAAPHCMEVCCGVVWCNVVTHGVMRLL